MTQRRLRAQRVRVRQLVVLTGVRQQQLQRAVKALGRSIALDTRALRLAVVATTLDRDGDHASCDWLRAQFNDALPVFETQDDVAEALATERKALEVLALLQRERQLRDSHQDVLRRRHAALVIATFVVRQHLARKQRHIVQ
ncbi:hypothetical protein PINS_up009033 [Pythium insidiosum]|nr:hypothetical protein PINS_up009033 [Pythium insidiosum]